MLCAFSTPFFRKCSPTGFNAVFNYHSQDASLVGFHRGFCSTFVRDSVACFNKLFKVAFLLLKKGL